MRTVRTLLKAKGYEIFSVAPKTLVFEALETMAEHNCGALLVLEGDNLVGIFSERDYARKVVLAGRASRQTPVKEIMTSDVTCIDIDSSIDECMALMSRKRFRHLPVLDAQSLSGVVSIGDVVHAVISEQEEKIEQLESYITAR